jgi:hypothetical protein
MHIIVLSVEFSPAALSRKMINLRILSRLALYPRTIHPAGAGRNINGVRKGGLGGHIL